MDQNNQAIIDQTNTYELHFKKNDSNEKSHAERFLWCRKLLKSIGISDIQTIGEEH